MLGDFLEDLFCVAAAVHDGISHPQAMLLKQLESTLERVCLSVSGRGVSIPDLDVEGVSVDESHTGEAAPALLKGVLRILLLCLYQHVIIVKIYPLSVFPQVKALQHGLHQQVVEFTIDIEVVGYLGGGVGEVTVLCGQLFEVPQSGILRGNP